MDRNNETSDYTVLQQSHLILLSVNVYNNILICFSLIRHDLINSVIVYEIHYSFVKWCDWFFFKFVVACTVVNRSVENADTESIEFTELPR